MDNGESPPVCDAAFLDQVAYTRRRVERWISYIQENMSSQNSMLLPLKV